MTPEALLTKLITDIEAKNYPLAVADAFQLAAVAIPWIETLFPVTPAKAKAFAVHSAISLDSTLADLKAQSAVGSINWETLIPLLMSLITQLLPLISTVA